MITSSYKRSTTTTTNRHSLNRKYDRVLARSRTRPFLNSGLLSAAPGYGSVQAARFKEREALFKHLGLTSEAEAQHTQCPAAYTTFHRQASFTQYVGLPRKAVRPRSSTTDVAVSDCRTYCSRGPSRSPLRYGCATLCVQRKRLWTSLGTCIHNHIPNQGRPNGILNLKEGGHPRTLPHSSTTT